MIRVRIVNTESELFNGTASFLSMRGSEGELGISPGHSPLLTGILPGAVEIKQENGELEVFYVSGGILEIQPDMVTILADTAIPADMLSEESEQNKQDQLRAQATTGADDWKKMSSQLAEMSAKIRAVQLIKKTRKS